MTNKANAERLRKSYLLNEGKHRKQVINICTAKRNWNGCDYCDIYAGSGLPCWEQTKKHNCIRCEEVQRCL